MDLSTWMKKAKEKMDKQKSVEPTSKISTYKRLKRLYKRGENEKSGENMEKGM